MNISIRTLKKMINDELERFKSETLSGLRKIVMADAIFEIVSDGFDQKIEKLKTLQSFDELDNFISECGYRMSLQEWIDSY